MPEDLFLNPRESLGRSFQRLVSEKPIHYLGFAPYMIHSNMRFVYIYNYIFGIREGIKRGKFKANENLLNLCKYVVQAKVDPFEETAGDHEPGLVAATREVACLLEQLLQSNDPYLLRYQLDLIRNMLIELCHHSDPEIEEENKSNFDAFTKSFNCVRGVAMHGIFQYSLYIAQQKGIDKSTKLEEDFLELEIQELLEEKLDKTNDLSPAVHSVYGCFLTRLYFLSSKWVKTHLLEIFPEENENSIYWKAAWDAYVLSSNVFPKIVEILIPQYQRGLLYLGKSKEEQEYWGNSPKERLAQHIFLAYLRNLTDFDNENKLLDLFFENAEDSVRAKGIFWLNQVLADEKPSEKDPLWSKCWSLWQRRIDYAETQEILQNSQEISNYMRWLKNCPLGMVTLFPILSKSIKYFHDSYDSMLLIEFAANQSEIFPLESITLLQMVILSAKDSWWNLKHEDEEKIIKMAIKNHNDKAKTLAFEIINYFGENGDYQWRNLLE